VVSGIKIHEIFIHLELGHTRLIKSKIIAAKKYLRTKNKRFRFEHSVLSFLEEFIHDPNEDVRCQSLTKAELAIEELFEDSTENTPVQYFYVRAWFQSKMQNRPLNEVLQKQLHRHYLKGKHEMKVSA
jgi:hypothetical protein